MLLTTHFEVTIHSKRIKDYYIQLGYVCRIHDKIIVPIMHMPKIYKSVKVQCDYCEQIQDVNYHKYIRNTKNNTCKYSYCTICGRLKAKEFLIKKYNVINVSQIELIKEKKKMKAQQNYNVDNISQSKIIQDKVKQTKKERYGNSNYINKQKGRETLLKNHGDDNYGKYGSESYNKKIKIKYNGIKPQGILEVKQKRKTTSIKNYSVDNPAKSEKVKDKMRQTSLMNYNVEYHLQNLIQYEKMQLKTMKMKKYKDTDLIYQGSYELDFLNYYNDFIIIKKLTFSIPYYFQNKKRWYISDFYLPNLNLIVEIKSNYYYLKYLDKNLAKQKICIEQGYQFIFIIDKDYKNLDKLLWLKFINRLMISLIIISKNKREEEINASL